MPDVIAMNLTYPPDREAYELLELASRGLHAAASGRAVPYVVAVQVDDPAQEHGVATHLVTNMEPAALRAALYELLDRLGDEQAKGRVSR